MLQLSVIPHPEMLADGVGVGAEKQIAYITVTVYGVR